MWHAALGLNFSTFSEELGKGLLRRSPGHQIYKTASAEVFHAFAAVAAGSWHFHKS